MNKYRDGRSLNTIFHSLIDRDLAPSSKLIAPINLVCCRWRDNMNTAVSYTAPPGDARWDHLQQNGTACGREQMGLSSWLI